MNQEEILNTDGGINWEAAIGGAAAGFCLGPEGAILGFIIGACL